MPDLPAIHLGRADTATVVGDEEGFELHFETAAARYVVNVHGCAVDLYWSARKEIGPWITDMEAARASRPLRDDPDAYAPDDPKRDDFHSVHADLYDSREGK